ncbi:MAG TPA: response regulator transcription factor [Verrucomicrobiae bacterium]|nr:response regulator transcription factor [Verrucomicrobiae bacterium]
MKILIVDDHAVVRQGLRHILADEFRRAEFGEARNATEALNRVWKEKWDTVVLDITMPGRSGFEVLREVKRAKPKLPVLVLSMHPEDQFAVRVLKSGASGYMNKESAPDELVGAIKKILAGGRYVSPALAEKMASYLAVDTKKPPHERLSDREFQVMRLIAKGKTVREIAEENFLSVKTVRTYRQRILEKTGMKRNAELTRYAIENHLME